MRVGLLWIACIIGFGSYAQTKFTINGYVRDSASGETGGGE